MEETYYVKCYKCGHTCQSWEQFDNEKRENKWLISVDWTWDYEHVCSTIK